MKKKLLLRIQSWFLVVMLALSSTGCGADVSEEQTETSTKATVEETYQPPENSSEDAASESIVETETATEAATETEREAVQKITLADIPEYDGDAYVMINDGNPFFSKDEIEEAKSSFETYGSLDEYGRCTTCVASVGQDIMPTEERGEIGSVKPTGWHTVKYDCVDGKYLYNRCHLLGFQLTAENANKQNLITGTRYLNIDGMLPFENMVADYVKETDNHVLYRVTPMFDGDDLVARGVLMEGMSIEDNGEGVLFNAFCYNVQPGVTIDYSSGESTSNETVQEDVSEDEKSVSSDEKQACDYVLNTNSMKFHAPGCSAAERISDKNRKEVNEDRQVLIDQGYSPCKICKP